MAKIILIWFWRHRGVTFLVEYRPLGQFKNNMDMGNHERIYKIWRLKNKVLRGPSVASYRLSVFKLLSIIYRVRSMFFFFFLFWSVNFLVPAIQARQKSELNSNFNPKNENKKTAVIDRGWFNRFFCFISLSGWVQKSRFESWLNVSIFTIFSLPFLK